MALKHNAMQITTQDRQDYFIPYCKVAALVKANIVQDRNVLTKFTVEPCGLESQLSSGVIETKNKFKKILGIDIGKLFVNGIHLKSMFGTYMWHVCSNAVHVFTHR